MRDLPRESEFRLTSWISRPAPAVLAATASAFPFRRAPGLAAVIARALVAGFESNFNDDVAKDLLQAGLKRRIGRQHAGVRQQG